jgi:hypothetical protein
MNQLPITLTANITLTTIKEKPKPQNIATCAFITDIHSLSNFDLRENGRSENCTLLSDVNNFLPTLFKFIYDVGKSWNKKSANNAVAHLWARENDHG